MYIYTYVWIKKILVRSCLSNTNCQIRTMGDDYKRSIWVFVHKPCYLSVVL